MYIVRWLMGHPIIATWVLGAIAVLLTMGSFNKEAVQVNSINMHSQNAEIINGSVEKIVELEREGVAIDASTAASQEIKENVLANETVPYKVDQKKIVNALTIKDESEVKASATTDLGQATTEEMLLMAREAYWNNGLDEAAQIYKTLIKNEPNVLEYQGELGNVYWRQGYPKKAAEIYSEIAIPMMEESGVERVSNMIGFIGLFYPDRAAIISERIQKNNKK